jgi:16S rRNA (guanine527-N7)-methyltransferase
MDRNEEFRLALGNEAKTYDLSLTTEVEQKLGDYFDLLSHWNARLHLVAPCPPEEFATRHVLESLLLLNYLPDKAVVVDIGSGGGLPIIPCLIARPDLEVMLIESSQKKGVFLREVLKRIVPAASAKVISKRFEDVESPEADFITCRALEQLVTQVPRMLDCAPAGSTLLLFGGDTIREALANAGAEFSEILIPQTQRRYLFVVRKP